MSSLEGALCAQTDPELFFGTGNMTKMLGKLCIECPVFTECLADIDLTRNRKDVFGFRASMPARQQIQLLGRDPDLFKYLEETNE